MHPKDDHVLTLAELGIDDDPGTSWHPHPGKDDARDDNGDLLNLTDAEAVEHQDKPEAAHQIDAGRPLSAEDSIETPDGEV